MNLFAKLNCVKYLSDTEHNIIDLINKDPVAFTQMTIREISSLAFVSKATIYRFCKKLGYSGLNELKLMVTASYADQLQHADKKVDLNIPFGKTDSAFTVISNLRDLYERSLFLATTFISVKDLQQIAVDLIHAVNIIVFVDDEQLHVAKIFKDRMESCGARVTVPANLYQKISLAQSAGTQDIAIYASYHPVQKRHLELAKILKGNQVKMVVISSSDDHLLNHHGDRNLVVGPIDHEKDKIADFAITIIFQFLFDSIYSVFFKEHYEENIENLRASYLKYRNI
ncbi:MULTISPECIES: MurR/RpiR family transcriptional regulator [Enterococcus]|uniref:MurR/RpiR family transcriptional regulator n=2 Tax=Enterococcus TaxID=1350 RepID=UPI0004022C20|nr:MurR/RpiR family transcriptional regulator [Enterococcus sp. 3C8_DIV0646]MBO1123457.1 MurR/RpiR family transcriptional regulator [Enterococcus casseliflavus]OTO30412.1 hypothetical protein A5876_001014 [Enterococcus sp. 3C8_DIV0646]